MGQCLRNVPLKPLSSYLDTKYLPGTKWSLNEQCKMILGPKGSDCSVNLFVLFLYKNRTLYIFCFFKVASDPICTEFWCQIDKCTATTG